VVVLGYKSTPENDYCQNFEMSDFVDIYEIVKYQRWFSMRCLLTQFHNATIKSIKANKTREGEIYGIFSSITKQYVPAKQKLWLRCLSLLAHKD
jgi:hypothetical protein